MYSNVLCSYDNKKKVLDDISFTANKNERIALIGRTGSGKTSLVNLICRFYDLNDGNIEISNNKILEDEEA